MRPVEDFVILFAFRWNSLENYSQQQHSNYAYWIDDFIAILMAALVKMNCWAFIRGKSLHFFHCITKWNMQKCLLYTSIRNSSVSHQIDGMNVLVAEIPWFSFARTTKIIWIGAKFVKNALSEFRRRKDQFKVLLRSAEQPKKHKHALKMYTINRPDADAIQ